MNAPSSKLNQTEFFETAGDALSNFVRIDRRLYDQILKEKSLTGSTATNTSTTL